MKKFSKLWAKYQISVYAFLAGLALCCSVCYGLYYFQIISLKAEAKQISDCEAVDISGDIRVKDPVKLLVDVRGAVAKPGVYELAEGTIIDQVIALVGGLKSDADIAWIDQNVNFVRNVEDREKLYFPYKQAQPVVSSEPVGSSSNQKISLNTDSKAELEELPGIGPSTADKIIQGRPYKNINDLLNVKGIGESLLEKIKDLVTL
jgi:competence protein ComEA